MKAKTILVRLGAAMKLPPGITKPEGYIEDPEERRRLSAELRGSMPELPTVEEFLRKRRAGLDSVSK